MGVGWAADKAEFWWVVHILAPGGLLGDERERITKPHLLRAGRKQRLTQPISLPRCGSLGSSSHCDNRSGPGFCIHLNAQEEVLPAAEEIMNRWHCPPGRPG